MREQSICAFGVAVLFRSMMHLRDRSTSSPTLCRLDGIAGRERKFQEGLKEYEFILRRFGDHSVAQHCYAWCLHQLQRYQEAEKAFERVGVDRAH
jgi:tetratricopeptide (TPR) repeat protein